MIDFPTMLMALKAKTIDGYIAEEPGAIADCQGNDELTYVSLANNDTGFTVEDLTNVTIAVGVQKGSELLAQVNAALASISEETRMQLLEEAIAQAAILGL
jgi:putative lysine transport system permease protein